MEMAEHAAREKGCVGIWLDTFDFQAPEFYKRHGYTAFGQVEDFRRGTGVSFPETAGLMGRRPRCDDTQPRRRPGSREFVTQYRQSCMVQSR